jgi:hypothetical protein
VEELPNNCIQSINRIRKAVEPSEFRLVGDRCTRSLVEKKLKVVMVVIEFRLVLDRYIFLQFLSLLVTGQ